MIKIENVQVCGWEPALRGMRNPLNSWNRSDSIFDVTLDMKSELVSGHNILGEKVVKDFRDCDYYPNTNYIVGENDLKLMRQLYKAGSVHRKYLRMIKVYADITASHTWWAEFDTYKVGTVRNSCSKMHKIHVKEFVKDDFDHEGIDVVDAEHPGFGKILDDTLQALEWLRVQFNETKDKKYWRAIIELLPMGYRIKATVEMDYENIVSMYRADSRRFHKLDEWCIHDSRIDREYFTDYGFCDFVERLPYFLDIVWE